MRILFGRIACVFVIFCATHGVKAADPFLVGGPTTTNNDASCDISVTPAATLLLPYFEVDLIEPAGETTIFTVTNVSQRPQIARVTLWTDLAYPVFAFNIYLTGYDVQAINLRDVIVHGKVAPLEGTGFDVSPVGELSRASLRHPAFNNPVIDEQTCTDLPLELSASLIARMRSAFTTGVVPGADAGTDCRTAGLLHTNAVGYATIDVVGGCGVTMPSDPSYFTNDIRFDNVLIGDYQQVKSDEDYAQGGTMVHIRAIPEGGTPQTRMAVPHFRVNSPRTFYSAYQDPARPARDARQPLPSLFAARWIEGGVTGFETFYKVWREVRRNAASCKAHLENSQQQITETVRFDEEENPEVVWTGCFVFKGPLPNMSCYFSPPGTGSTSLVDVSRDDNMPPNTQGAVAGWMYMNLDDLTVDDVAKQAWVTISMRAEDRFSTDLDAAILGNGCSAPVAFSEATSGYNAAPIGPAPNTRK